MSLKGVMIGRERRSILAFKSYLKGGREGGREEGNHSACPCD